MVDVAEVLPVAIYPCVAEPTISTCLLVVAPTLILLLEPSSIMLPSPKLIDACVDEISILFASTSKVPVFISIVLPLNFKCPPVPTAENNGVEPAATPRNTPTSP